MQLNPESPEVTGGDLDQFDKYRRWLQIPENDLPPTHYVLLGIDNYEEDFSVIEQAAKKRTTHLHQMAAGPDRAEVQKLMGEIAVARRVLLSPDSKADYDHKLETGEWYQPQDSQHASVETTQPKPTLAPVVVASSTVGQQTGSQQADELTDEQRAEQRSLAAACRRRKSKWAEYKIHLASATVLLGIVGVVWFVNRSDGKSSAAKVGKIDESRDSRAPSIMSTNKAATPSNSSRSKTVRRPSKSKSSLAGKIKFKSLGGDSSDANSQKPNGSVKQKPNSQNKNIPASIQSDDERMLLVTAWAHAEQNRPINKTLSPTNRATTLRLFGNAGRIPGSSVMRLRVDPTAKKAQFVISEKLKLSIHAAKFNDFAIKKPPIKNKSFAFAESMGAKAGKLTRGAVWGTNYLLISFAGEYSKVKKPAVLVFSLIDGDGDKKYRSPKDKIVLHGVVSDPDFQTGKKNNNTVLNEKSVRDFVSQHIGN